MADTKNSNLPPAIEALCQAPPQSSLAEASGYCPVRVTQNILAGKWKLLLLATLMQGAQRYSELQRAIPEISEKMLIQSLRQLEADRIIARTTYGEVPPRVEYHLTALGWELREVFQQMVQWGKRYLDRYDPGGPRTQADEATA
jgi:DNA-binding HxlR family transcriptional regulator